MANTEKPRWKEELSEYIKQGEPDQSKRSQLWSTAIGLQAVDGLSTSDYLLETAKQNIEGLIDIDEAGRRIDTYYKARNERTEQDMRNKEGDTVSQRITQIIGERTFSLSPPSFISLHKRLFSGLFQHAGTIRTYNITKKEWCLNGDTVTYADYGEIPALLEYDFQLEQKSLERGITMDVAVAHFSKFASNLWQIHPFCEGNTRTTAVFLIKYLNYFGLNLTNQPFEDHSWYFRNALVRANYSNLLLGIRPNPKFLEIFLSNLILKTDLPLKNRHLHIESNPSDIILPGTPIKNCQLSLIENVVLNILNTTPHITQNELAQKIDKSVSTVKRILGSLREKGCIVRENGKRFGSWKVQK